MNVFLEDFRELKEVGIHFLNDTRELGKVDFHF